MGDTMEQNHNKIKEEEEEEERENLEKESKQTQEQKPSQKNNVLKEAAEIKEENNNTKEDEEINDTKEEAENNGTKEDAENNGTKEEEGDAVMSKRARKKQAKLQGYEAKKAYKKEQERLRRKEDLERRRNDWEDRLSKAGNEEERKRLIEAKMNTRNERMAQRQSEREAVKEKLGRAMVEGQKIVVDMEFSHLMTSSELNSISQQIMYSYAANKKSATPVHLWLTGCHGEVKNQLQKVPGFDSWLIEKEERSYVDAFSEQKENLVYLTADSDDILQDLEPSKIYIIGGLVDRNRWKGITMKKATEQGIKTARLPISDHLKMASSQVLTVNQVFEILLTFLESRDWKKSFFQVVPSRKRPETESNSEGCERKKLCVGADNKNDGDHIHDGRSVADSDISKKTETEN